MTNPSDPGRPQRPPAPGGPGGPYGPPPQPYPGNIPNPRPPGPGQGPGQGIAPGPQQQEWTPPERTGKGLFGALFDANFDHLVAPKLVKLCYIVSMLLVSLQCVVFFVFALWLSAQDDWWGWGIILLVATPLTWLFEMLLVRIFMEAVVIRFKISEYLRIIKDKI